MANKNRQQLAYQTAKVCMKKAKAFDIIKEKNITPYEDVIQHSDYLDYLCFRGLCETDLEENESLASKELTKEEFDLLKEVLL